VPVIISNGVTSLCANSLLGVGSDSTFISHDLANSLHLRGTNHSLEISNAISATTKLTSHLVNFEISSTTHPKKIPLNNICVVKELNLSLPNLSLKKEIQSYPHLKNINFPKFESSTIDILIGADMPSLHFHHDIKRGKETDPVGILTQLGWVIMGGKSSCQRVSNNHISMVNDKLHNAVERFWTVESYGTVEKDSSVLMSDQDKRAMEILEKTSINVGGRYSIGLLWKYDNPKLQNNTCLAISRLKGLEKRFMKDPLSEA